MVKFIFDACLYFFSTLLKTCSQVSQISCLRIASVQKNPPFNRFVRKANVLKKTDLIQLHYWFEHNTESGNAGDRLLSAKSIDDEDWPKKFKLR